MKTIITNNVNETYDLANKIYLNLPIDISTILLEGDLGSGKTTFVQGFGKSAGVKKNINSPTFTIMKIYDGDKKIYHFDFYRLESLGLDFDLSDYIEEIDSISLIEWPFNVREVLPNKYLLIKITNLDETKRQFSLSVVGFDEKWMEKI